MKTVAIVISPVYTPDTLKFNFTKEESISLEHLRKYLNKYDMYFIVPDGTDIRKQILSKFRSIKLPEKFHFIKFPKKYFGTPQKHAQLLLTKQFYSSFKDYQYILLHHTDSLVFSDQLLQWCKKDYDYVAGPWFNSRIGFLTHKRGSPANVGNGGLSLRKVQSFLQVYEIVKKLAKRKTANPKIRMFWFWTAVITGKSHKIWLDAPINNYPFNEDGFWSLEAPKYQDNFKVVPFSEALKFSFEKFPRKCFELNKRKLPFGCHAWGKYDKDFWLPYL